MISEHKSGGEIQVVEQFITKNVNSITAVFLAFVSALSAWVVRLSARLRLVEENALTNRTNIQHMLNDLTQLRHSVHANHAETTRLIERVFDKIDNLKKE